MQAHTGLTITLSDTCVRIWQVTLVINQFEERLDAMGIDGAPPLRPEVTSNVSCPHGCFESMLTQESNQNRSCLFALYSNNFFFRELVAE